MLVIQMSNQAARRLEPVLSICFFEGGRSMQPLCYLAKALGIHSLLIVLPEHSQRRLHLLVHLLFTPLELLSIGQNFFLLVCHLALQFAYLALKQLHFLCP